MALGRDSEDGSSIVPASDVPDMGFGGFEISRVERFAARAVDDFRAGSGGDSRRRTELFIGGPFLLAAHFGKLCVGCAPS
jgi:hypothetical protein